MLFSVFVRGRQMLSEHKRGKYSPQVLQPESGPKEKALYRQIKSVQTTPDWLSTKLLEAFGCDGMIIAALDPSKTRSKNKTISDRQKLLAIGLGVNMDAAYPRTPETLPKNWPALTVTRMFMSVACFSYIALMHHFGYVATGQS